MKKYMNVNDAYFEIGSFFKFIVFRSVEGKYMVKCHSKYGKEHDISVVVRNVNSIEEAKKKVEEVFQLNDGG